MKEKESSGVTRIERAANLFILHPSAPRGLRPFLLCSFTATALLAPGIASAQDYPSRPIRVLVPSTPEEFGEFIKSETAKWGKVIRAAGLRTD